ncbi:peptidylprolyl isomerase [Magnetospirillum sp. SS-4]|uniref:FKBP-type peptidyl-prolyl cis-trans isomerase n=1 Tax=Magnetospirillum sp. SS-4 TaxID=2681465 RepID=UPI00137C9E59|nr:peptidylprolyl isomerase [Magnetospirillum sp. SS-4]CAA7612713.1 Peptidyl-prolyl cis-trans isomerase [Magnetospirillum sp. SS-4]
MSATISKDTVVTLDYRVTDSDGQLVDDGPEPLSYLHGGYDGIFPKLEAELDGKAVGAKVSVRLDPGEAFGEYSADLVQVEPLESFPDGTEIGSVFEGMQEGGDEVRLFRVTDIEEGQVVLDGNHPLAGVTLNFSCTVAAIRPANQSEISAGVAGVTGH